MEIFGLGQTGFKAYSCSMFRIALLFDRFDQAMIQMVHEYRDRIYIRKDILLKLYEYGELNQSKLMSYCGLNNVKHKEILDDMAKKEMIIRTEERWGNKNIIKYRVSEKGNEILREILEPYESLFPRSEREKQS
jgi:predicted transcriptional regulator